MTCPVLAHDHGLGFCCAPELVCLFPGSDCGRFPGSDYGLFPGSGGLFLGSGGLFPGSDCGLFCSCD